MKSLVTGGAGFIGSHVVDSLIEMGHEVVALDDLSGGFKDNVHSEANFIKGSVTDNSLVDLLFEKNSFDYVFHLAAYAAEGLSHFIKKFNYENNLIGSVNLINCSVNHNVKCFVFTSSIAVYGRNQLPMKEDMTPMPEDSYGIAKLAVEKELQISHEMFGLNYVIFRPHNVYGERQNIGDKYRNVVGIFMNQILQGKPLTIFGDGKQTRAFSYIKDVAPVIAGSIENPKAYTNIFNVGADKPYSVNFLADKVAEAMGTKAKINHLPPRNEVVEAYSSHEKAKEMFKIDSSVSLEEGLAAMASWVKKIGARESSKFKNIEIRKNLPPSWSE